MQPVFLVGGTYRPHLRAQPSGEDLGVAFVEGPPVTRPGERAQATAALAYDIDYSVLQPGAELEVLEGNRRVATGTVLRRWTTDLHWHNYSPCDDAHEATDPGPT